MTVVLREPYRFIPPYRKNGWPNAIQWFRLIDWHLRRKECVVDYECRHLDRFESLLRSGDGILLAPNHCRYADPIVLGWPAREVGTHLYAMASWHLFNTTSFERFALRRMGAFSIFREGNDKQALDTAIQILADAERPLIIFPEGTTNRTNDLLKPLLDGIAFIARMAAKRRQKRNDGKVVVQPVALKYLCQGDIHPWADQQLAQLETQIGWHAAPEMALLPRTVRLAEGMLALKEVEYVGKTSAGALPQRRDRLMRELLRQAEEELQLSATDDQDIRDRVRKIRAAVSTGYFALTESQRSLQRKHFKGLADKADFAQNLLSFPDEYLTPGQVTDTRLLETIQRIQETIHGKARETMPLKIVIEFGEAIEVPAERAPRAQRDPIMIRCEEQLTEMLGRLATEARPIA